VKDHEEPEEAVDDRKLALVLQRHESVRRVNRSDILALAAAFLLVLAMAGCVTTTATTGSYVNGTAMASSSSTGTATTTPGTAEQQRHMQQSP
jgi:hypothetical protein